jgi:hypothetical protein
VNSGNMMRPATSDANAHKFNNTRFFLVFPVDVGTMNNSQTKAIKLDKTHRSTCNLIPLDRVGVPNLSVRWIISIGGGGDS